MDLSKINPNDLTLAGFLFLFLLFITTQVWPVIRDKWIPAQLDMAQAKIRHEYEVSKENLSILTGIKETLAKMSAQLDIQRDIILVNRDKNRQLHE